MSSGGDDDDDEMGVGGGKAWGPGSPRVGFGTPAQTNPKGLRANFGKTPSEKYENKEGQNKDEGRGSSPMEGRKGAQNKCRVWIKGPERKLTKPVLKGLCDRVLGCINTGRNEANKFTPKELIFNSEMHLSLIFADEVDAEEFVRVCMYVCMSVAILAQVISPSKLKLRLAGGVILFRFGGFGAMSQRSRSPVRPRQNEESEESTLNSIYQKIEQQSSKIEQQSIQMDKMMAMMAISQGTQEGLKQQMGELGG